MFIDFPTHLDSRICPVVGASTKTLLSFRTVQHEKVMVVQKHPKTKDTKHIMVYFNKTTVTHHGR